MFGGDLARWRTRDAKGVFGVRMIVDWIVDGERRKGNLTGPIVDTRADIATVVRTESNVHPGLRVLIMAIGLSDESIAQALERVLEGVDFVCAFHLRVDTQQTRIETLNGKTQSHDSTTNGLQLNGCIGVVEIGAQIRV